MIVVIVVAQIDGIGFISILGDGQFIIPVTVWTYIEGIGSFGCGTNLFSVPTYCCTRNTGLDNTDRPLLKCS